MRGRALRTGTTVVTVTFKNIKTAKSTAKKYRCVVKAAIEPEKPVEPEVVKATKITEAKVSTAKTVSVTFDGAVDTSTATAIKLVRGTIDAPVTVAYATDSKSATLTSATPLAAGTYTLTVGSFEPVNFTVTKQTATKLEITSTTVANKNGAGVGFQVLDQYGDPMSNYTAKKLAVKAYNATKGHDVKENTDISKSYFELDCQTQDATQINGVSVINAIGDTVTVVAYLKDNASVSCTANLTITNIYMESLDFGEPEVGNDKRVTVNKTYKLPYTAKTNEGKDTLFAKEGTKGTNVISRTFGDYTFVTSNVSALDMGKFYVDKDGNMFFTASATAGTAVITAINTKTGSTVTTTIVVNDVPALSRVDVADASVAWNAGMSGAVEVKAAVTAYDQFDEVIDSKDIKNLTFNPTDGNGVTSLTGAFSSVTRIPVGAGVRVKKFSNDGKYLIYEVNGNNGNYEGQSITFNFTSSKIGPSGYVTCKSIVDINDRTEANALVIVAEPDATKEENGTVEVKFSVQDQYQNNVVLSTSGTAMLLTCTAPGKGNIATTTYTIEPEVRGSVATISAISFADVDHKVGKFKFQLQNGLADLYKDGVATVKLMNGDDQVDAKDFNIKAVKAVDKYDVMTDKTSYKAGDTITITVGAYSFIGSKFNQYFNGSHNVQIDLMDDAGVVSTTRKTLEFKNGEASFTDTAGKATTGTNKYYYKVTKIDATSVNGSSAVNDKFIVEKNDANKIVVDETNGLLHVVDTKGNDLTTTPGKSYATVIVYDETLKQDITSVSTIKNNAAQSMDIKDKTAEVEYNNKYEIVTIGGITYSMATGFNVIVPATSQKSNISLTITINGYKWSDTVYANNSTTVPFANTDASGVAALNAAKAAVLADGNAVKNAIISASAATASNTSVQGSATISEGSTVYVTGSGITISGAGITTASAIDITNQNSGSHNVGLTVTGTATQGTDAVTVDYTVSISKTSTVNGIDKTATRNITITIQYSWDGSKWVGNVLSQNDTTTP